VDIFAPGTSITSAWHTSNTATNSISGTSMASPHVAGAAALYLGDNPSATPAQVASGLVSASAANKLSGIPSGTPNRLLQIGEGGGDPGPGPGERFTNGTNVAINDHRTSTSTIPVSGIGSVTTFSVDVDIVHTWIGDLTVDVVAPNGTSFRVWNRTGGSADDIHQTFNLNGNGLNANGTWTLRVTDHATYDTGYIDSWSLVF
jgi:subtilisin family serine protease